MLTETDHMIGDLLAHRGIRYSYLGDDLDFLSSVEKKTKDILLNDQRGREIDKIFYSVFKGECLEYGLYNYLGQFVETTHNDEKASKKYFWDLSIAKRLTEIKNHGTATYFELPLVAEGEMQTHWKFYDLIIACYLNTDEQIIVPRYLVSSAAMDSSLGLYIDSHRPGFTGKYLRRNAFSLGYARELNSSHKCVHVDQLVIE